MSHVYELIGESELQFLTTLSVPLAHGPLRLPKRAKTELAHALRVQRAKRSRAWAVEGAFFVGRPLYFPNIEVAILRAHRHTNVHLSNTNGSARARAPGARRGSERARARYRRGSETFEFVTWV